MLLKVVNVVKSTDTFITVAVDTKDGIIEIDSPASLFNGEAIFVNGVVERIESFVYIKLPVTTKNGMSRIWVKQHSLME